MKLLALSELASASDTALVGLHDQLHDDLATFTQFFRSWYHDQLVTEMEAKDLAHYERDDLDQLSDLPDYELASEIFEAHFHQTMLFEDGRGFTDVVDGHYHLVAGGKILKFGEHDHRLKLPAGFGVRVGEDLCAQAAKSFVEKMTKNWGSLSLAGGMVAEAEGHVHKVVILEPEMGYGQTSFNEGHNHWVYDWSVQASDDHVHDLDPSALSEMSGWFQAVDEPVEAEPKSVQLDTSNHKSFIDVAFGKASCVVAQLPDGFKAGHLSSSEAWELWGSTKSSLLITSILPGLECQAHIQYLNGEVSSAVFIEGKDVTELMVGLAGSLRCINLEEGDQVVLSGILTSRSDRTNAVQSMKQAVADGIASTTGTFYVEDCWFDGGPIEHWTAEQRRRRANSLLSASTVASLKLLPWAATYDEAKALRVTEQSMSFDGAMGVRWRDAEADLATPPEEILIY